MKHNRLMNFVGIGFSKCGSSWLSSKLSEHPEIYIPEEKELHYFNNINLKKGLLERIFINKKEKCIGEFTPRYIIDENTLKNILKYNPNIKILIVLRDPVERTISQYNYFKNNLQKEDKPFFRALEGVYKEDYIMKSMYDVYLKYVFEFFDKKKIKIVFYDDIKNNPEKVIKECYNFLDVDSSFLNSGINQVINKTEEIKNINPILVKFNKLIHQGKNIKKKFGVPDTLIKPFLKVIVFIENKINLLKIKKKSRKKVLTNEEKQFIYNKYFKNSIEELEKLLDKDLSHWKK